MRKVLDRILCDKKVHIGVLAAVLIAAALLFYERSAFIGTLWLNYNDAQLETAQISLKDVGQITQEFGYINNITSIDMLVSNEGSDTEKINFAVYNKETDLLMAKESATVEYTGADAAEIKVPVTLLQEVDPENTQIKAYLVITSEQSDTDLSVWISKEDEDHTFYTAYQQGEVTRPYRVRMQVHCSVIGLRKLQMITALCMFVPLLLLFLPWKKRFSPQRCFAILALLLGVAFAMINPMGQESDGWDHFLRSMDVSYGNVLYPFASLTHENGVITVPQNVDTMEFMVVEPDDAHGSWMMVDLKSKYFTKETMEMEYDGGVTSLYYLPQGFGLLLGRLFGLSMYYCVVLARVMNLLAYMGLTYVAIRKIPVYKHLLLAIALMPMSLYQAASLSSDALLNGLCFLFTALVFSYAQEKEKTLNWRHGLLLAGILLYIFVGKYVYACIGLLVFAIPKERFGGWKGYGKSFGVALIPLILVGGFLVLHLTQSVSTLQDSTGGMTQTQYVMAHPLLFLRVVAETFKEKIGSYLGWLNYLGWLRYPLGPLTSLVPIYLVGVGALDVNASSRRLSDRAKILSGVTVVLLWIAIMLGMYIGDARFNEVGAKIVEGCQGRYFIPLLMLPFLALGTRRLENHIDRFAEKTAGIMGFMTAYGILLLVGYCY